MFLSCVHIIVITVTVFITHSWLQRQHSMVSTVAWENPGICTSHTMDTRQRNWRNVAPWKLCRLFPMEGFTPSLLLTLVGNLAGIWGNCAVLVPGCGDWPDAMSYTSLSYGTSWWSFRCSSTQLALRIQELAWQGGDKSSPPVPDVSGITKRIQGVATALDNKI